MKERMTLVQARISWTDATQLDADAEVLGLVNRSDAVRAGLRLLHRRARHTALAREYDDFYGSGAEAPVGETVTVGDQIAADTLADAPPKG